MNTDRAARRLLAWPPLYLWILLQQLLTCGKRLSRLRKESRRLSDIPQSKQIPCPELFLVSISFFGISFEGRLLEIAL